jgi:hypothetical protein
MKVSITLPSIFPDALDRALANIRATTRGAYEVIVVSPFRVKAPDVVWIEETERRGCAFAHTVAAHQASGDFITATADDCAYQPGWDAAAIANYEERAPRAGKMLCLGLHYGLLGTVFGIYYGNFPFLRRTDAMSLGFFDGKYKKGFTDSDLGFKVWSAGGRCEHSKQKLIEITAEDKRKGAEDCPDDDLGYFVEKWGERYGRGFDTSYMRAINVDFDPDLHPEFVQEFSVFDNTPDFVARLAMHSPPHMVEAIGRVNIALYRGVFYCVPRALGSINFMDERHRRRFRIVTCQSIESARATAKQLNSEKHAWWWYVGMVGKAVSARRKARSLLSPRGKIPAK